MDQTIILPSVNWFQVSVLAVSQDGWLIYGGPSKSLCILEPLKPEDGILKGNQSFRAHVVNRAHLEKIVSVDISKEWPEKKLVLTGSADGTVKQWSLENYKNSIRAKSTHSHDIHHNDKEEIAGLGYSTKVFAITVGVFGNIVKWDLKSNVVKNYTQFLRNFKPTSVACSPHIPLNVAVGTKQGVVFVLELTGVGKIMMKVRGQDDEIVNLSWCPQYEVILKKTLKESKQRSRLPNRLENVKSQEDCRDALNDSGIAKNLPDDSFDESMVQEDDTFDIYKDHEADEFGHKKFQPTDIVVKMKEEQPSGDFLADCLKLKEQILNKKDEPTIATLVDALDKTHVDSDSKIIGKKDAETNEEAKTKVEEPETNGESQYKDIDESSCHIYKHLLVTIGKYGGVRMWSKSGKLVGSCAVPNAANKNQRNKAAVATTVLWYRPEVLLIADGKSQMLECNPLKIDCKNKLDWQVVHTLHKRGLYAIATNAPRVQTEDTNGTDNWVVWSISQDRNFVCYSLERKQTMAVYNTCGGFVYTIQHCPYDARRIAVSVGDGSVRVLRLETVEDDNTKLTLGTVTSYWQNVQGKVLTVAWHPTKENLLAFGTAEARVGLLEAGRRGERPARPLVPALRGGVYSLCWGRGDRLYACGAGALLLYEADKVDKDPVPVKVQFEGKEWELSSVSWHERALLCGGVNGGVAVLEPDTHQLITATFLFSKMIHCTDWHPQLTSSCSSNSVYKDLIAVSSLDKQCSIVIVEYADKGDGPRLHQWKVLTGHKATVLQLSWNPHNDVQLLSTSHDSTVRVWDVRACVCVCVYGGHSQASLGGWWARFPEGGFVVSGGADCSVRLWRAGEHPAHRHAEIHHELAPRADKRNKIKKADVLEADKPEGRIAASVDGVPSRPPKKFLLPLINRQTSPCTAHGVRRMVQRYWDDKRKADGELTDDSRADDAAEEVGDDEDEEKAVDFTKIFGTTNDINEVLDMEMRAHCGRGAWEARAVLWALRGHVAELLQAAARHARLCPFVLSLAPAVSHKYWKDATQMYLAQIDRMVAQGEEYKLYENKYYGGAIYRKVCLQLSTHDVLAAVDTLLQARLYKEAYVLARARHMDTVAEDTLKKWAEETLQAGYYSMSAVCYLALGDPHQAALVLSKTEDQELLSIAADLAKRSGQPTFADHIEDKRIQIKTGTPDSDDQDLKPLPSKIDLLKDCIDVGDVDSD